MSSELRVFADATAAAQACGAEILRALAAAREARGVATVAVRSYPVDGLGAQRLGQQVAGVAFPE